MWEDAVPDILCPSSKMHGESRNDSQPRLSSQPSSAFPSHMGTWPCERKDMRCTACLQQSILHGGGARVEAGEGQGYLLQGLTY